MTQITIKITGMNRREAEVMLEPTPIDLHEHLHRGIWQRSKLTVNRAHVGWLEANRWPTGEPLHIILDLNVLQEVDEDWQCTLETLGVLK